MFSIDSMSRTPIYEQIINQIESFILKGVLSPGDRLPSVRSLSVELSITPVTVLKALGELDLRGLIRSVPGKGYFVCEGAKDTLSESRRVLLDKIEELAHELAAASLPMEDVMERIRKAYAQTESNERNV